MNLRSIALALGLASIAAPAQATFHLWEVTEIFSNDDGTVQFVEFFSEDPGQEFLAGHTLETVQQNVMRKQFTFPASIPVPQGESTAVRHFLVATPGFVAVAGIAPDFEIPAGFLEPGIIDEVALVGADAMDFAAGRCPRTE